MFRRSTPPPVRSFLRVALLLVPIAAFTAPPPATAADAVRLIASDPSGVTLELVTGAWRLEPLGGTSANAGRSLLVASGLAGHGLPGRPVIPGASALIALPPGARATARLLEGSETLHEGVRLAPGERRGFTDDRGGLGAVPFAEAVPPIVDGPWPVAALEVGTAFALRGQRLVSVRIVPFRYDEATGRLWVRDRMRVRVEFTGGPGATPGFATQPLREDRHWDPVLRGAVINFEQGRAWRTAPGPAAKRTSLFDRPQGDGTLFGRGTGPLGAAGTQLFDESETEVRIQLDSSAVNTVTYAQLAAKGYPAGVPVAEVSVHRHEFLEDQIPSYETIELPIEVDEGGAANGVFDGTDRIVMWVQSWAQRSGVSLPQRAWGDGEVVYATRVARAALRVGGRNGWRGLALTALASYPWTQRWEGNYFHLPFPGASPAETLFDQFHWTPYVQYYSPPDTFPFEVNDIDQTRDITFRVAWQGRRLGIPYLTYASVHDENPTYTVVADSVLWSGKSNQIVTRVIPGTSLSEGLTNGFVQRGRNATGPPNPSTNAIANASLNWFEATYWRRYQALAGYLPLNSGEAAGEYEIRAAGFGANATLRVYDVTDPLDPRRLTGVQIESGGDVLRLQDSTATGARRSYVAFTQPRAVPDGRITPVSRQQLSASAGGDYLIIAPGAFGGAAASLAALRQSQGLAVVNATLESVLDEFNGGRRSAHALRRAIRFALNQWNAKFVVLIGDGTEDPLNRMGTSGPDIIPVPLLPAPVSVGDGREIVPSDGWLVWCLNGCPPDPVTGYPAPIVPELFIGRLPATTPQEAADIVDKISRYENFSADQTWRNEILLFSDDEFSSITTFGGGGGSSQYCRRFYEDRFRRLNETIRSAIVDSAGLRRSQVEHFDLGVWLAGIPAPGDCRADEIAAQNFTRDLVTGELLTRLNTGRMWWNYQGHANEFVLAHENFYRNFPNEDDKDRLVNTDKPFLLSAFSCHVNAFGRVGERRPVIGPAIGEDLVLLPRRGAIASYASVGYEIIPDNGSDHINVAWARAMFLDPPFDDLLGNGDTGARTILGEGIALGYLRYVPTVPTDNTENGVALTYHLLGDPATRLSIGPPQALVTANGDTVVSGRPVALAPPRDSLLLEAELVSTVEIESIELIEITSTGPRTLPDSMYTLTPPFPDTAPGGNGGRRYHLSYAKPLSAGTLSYTLRIVDRYGLVNDFNILFPLNSQLLASGNVLADDDRVTPTTELSLRVELPTPLTNPLTQMSLAVDSLPQTFTATQLDSVGRQFLLRWTHTPYAIGAHLVELTALDSLERTHRFRVVDPALAENRLLRDVLAFPNPMDEEMGTTFGMYLIADGPSDVLLRVFSVTGRVLYERMERDLGPGYHQWPWNGRDSAGDLLANGTYLFKVSAQSGSRKDSIEGRLVKLRKPRRSASATP